MLELQDFFKTFVGGKVDKAKACRNCRYRKTDVIRWCNNAHAQYCGKHRKPVFKNDPACDDYKSK